MVSPAVTNPKKTYDLVPQGAKDNCPGLKPDFDYLEQKLMPDFWRHDAEAGDHQKGFRRKQQILIWGGTLATILGAVQASYQSWKWPGFAEAAIGALLIAVAYTARQMRDQELYLKKRLRAELLRGEYFMYLGRVGAYADDATRRNNLITRVAEINRG